MAIQNEVYDSADNDGASCYFCQKDGDHRSYQRGEIFLAGPAHYPRNGEANYVCRRHLDDTAIIVKMD